MPSSLPSECEQLLISGYVLGNLSSAEATLFESILQENPEIARQVEELQQTLEVAYFPPEVTPPPSLKAKLLATTASSNSSPVTSETPHFLTQWSQKLSLVKVFGAISAALIVGLGITNYWFWQTLQRASIETPASPKLIYSLEGVDSEAKARLVVNPNQLDATLTVSNLSPLPEGKVYALWTVVGKEAPFTTDSKGAILTDVFQVNNQGEVSKNITVPRVHRNNQQIQKIAITIENESAPQAHTGSILMSTQYPNTSYFLKF